MYDLTPEKRKHLWERLSAAFEQYYTGTAALPVAPRLDQPAIQAFIRRFNGQPEDLDRALDHVLEGLTRYAVHTPHPMYYGLYNPRASFAGILADTITAFFNPQMAAWSHAPFAAEVESFLIAELGRRFGYPESSVDGAFTSGGAEANLTALLCAAQHHFPDRKQEGWQSIAAKPLIYCSKDCHHSVIKAAQIIGLGMNAVRSIDTDAALKMDPQQLEQQIIRDLEAGYAPMMVIATEGVTGTGVIDDIGALLPLREKYGFWLHADAAYGGAAVLSERHKHWVAGIEHADSITFDAHKWLSIPMAAGIFITRHPDIMSRTFGISTEYMPKDATGLDIVDPYTHTIQWSRRFTGLKLYLSVLLYGWEGLEQLVEQQISTGEYLRKRLSETGWKIYNATPLPVVCFGQESMEQDPAKVNALCQQVIGTGKAWISVYKINEVYTLRACITNYNTTEQDIEQLLSVLSESLSAGKGLGF
jgi:aromatic-L-amino-acid/L-tryptophan decarboxylase